MTPRGPKHPRPLLQRCSGRLRAKTGLLLTRRSTGRMVNTARVRVLCLLRTHARPINVDRTGDSRCTYTRTRI